MRGYISTCCSSQDSDNWHPIISAYITEQTEIAHEHLFHALFLSSPNRNAQGIKGNHLNLHSIVSYSRCQASRDITSTILGRNTLYLVHNGIGTRRKK